MVTLRSDSAISIVTPHSGLPLALFMDHVKILILVPSLGPTWADLGRPGETSLIPGKRPDIGDVTGLLCMTTQMLPSDIWSSHSSVIQNRWAAMHDHHTKEDDPHTHTNPTPPRWPASKGLHNRLDLNNVPPVTN
jgi:hypothetical protein